MSTNLTIKSRLIIILASLSLLALVLGASGLFGMSKTKDGLRSVYENRTIPMGKLSQIKVLILDNQLQLSLALLNPTTEMINRETSLVEKNLGEAGDIWAAYSSNALSPEEKKLADKFEENHGHFITEGVLPVISLLREGKPDEAKRVETQTLTPLYVPVREQIDALSAVQLDMAKREYDASVSRYVTTRNISIVLIIIGLMFAALMGILMIRSILQKLGGEPDYAAEIVSRIAKGDLTVKVQTHTNDRGSMLLAIKDMAENLAAIVTDVRRSTETITSASHQIAAGNNDLSQRTAEQAANLEETSSSMEELASTVRQNAENARQANQLAVNASDVAIKGGHAVNEVVQTMSAISDSSKKIVEIISVIEGIAFQTNILALNAAVEAARAGEQGRGFAVVAAEVRSLAQRSAAAAKEISSLINASVDKVDTGAKQVDKAGVTMNEIVTAVKRVTDIMSEIAAASNEQNSGIEQVNEAITQMDETTQQNAALVEEAAAAAEAMQQQAIGLMEAVSVFKLDGSGGDTQTKIAEPRIEPAEVKTERRGRERKLIKAEADTDGDWKEF